MQTFSLNTSPSAKSNLSDAMSKNELNVNKQTSEATKTPFQMELTKQARKQTSQPNQTKPTVAHNKVTQNVQPSKQSATNKPEVTDKSSAEKSDEQIASVVQVALLDLGLTDKLADARLLSESKEKKDANFDNEVKSDDMVVNQDNNILALIAPNPLVQNNATPLQNTQNTTDLTEADAKVAPNPLVQSAFLQNSQNTTTLTEGDAKVAPNLLVKSTPLPNTTVLTEGVANPQIPSVIDDVTKKQTSLDVMLGNALSQTKNIAVMEKEATDSTVGKVSDPSNKTNTQLEITQLETSPVKSGREDMAANKVMLNAMGALANKEVATNATVAIGAQAIQATQVSNFNASSALVAQQAGSTNSINVYPGKAGWDQAITQKVIWMVGSGEQSASLTLNPPDLGPLKVVIHVHNDQADTTFISDNDEVRQALENGLSNLRDKMNESGIQLGQTNVSTSGQSQQSFQQATQNRAVAQAQQNFSASQADAVAKPSQTVRVANGLVDTFA